MLLSDKYQILRELGVGGMARVSGEVTERLLAMSTVMIVRVYGQMLKLWAVLSDIPSPLSP